MWTPAPRTDAALAALAATDAARRERPDDFALDAERIAAAAAGDRGDALFDPGWREGLEHYAGSAAEDGRLTSLGIAMSTERAIDQLRSGAAIAALRRDRPDIACTPIAPPIFITGGWRTGTTFLFRLLATDPQLRAPLPAELRKPWRTATLTGDEREQLLDASGAASEVLNALNPGIRAIHDFGPHLPEECGLAMGTDLRSWSLSATVRLDSYSEWLSTQDLGPTYRNYRRVLECLDAGDGRRWVLKAPPHLAELSSLAGAFPGAVVVVLHRDVVETIASGASLFAVFRSTYSDDVDAVDVGRFQADQTEQWMRRAQAFRRSDAAGDVTIVDLHYTDLVADPGAAIARVCVAAGLAPPADTAAFVDAYNHRFPRHAHGAHRYSAADFGLDEHEIRQRFASLDAQ